MLREIREYIWAVMRHWMLLLVALAGLVGDGATIVGDFDVPHWVWYLLIVTGLFGAQYRAYRDAARKRDEERNITRTTIQQRFVHAAPESNVEVTAFNNQMIAAAGGTFDPRHPDGRGRSRWLTPSARRDLAERCERCSNELLAWYSGRREPYFDPFTGSADERKEELKKRHEYGLETSSEFAIRFAVTSRDLLNECVEAGYVLPHALEGFRLYGWANEPLMREVGQGVGVMGRRVRRKSKRI